MYVAHCTATCCSDVSSARGLRSVIDLDVPARKVKSRRLRSTIHQGIRRFCPAFRAGVHTTSVEPHWLHNRLFARVLTLRQPGEQLQECASWHRWKSGLSTPSNLALWPRKGRIRSTLPTRKIWYLDAWRTTGNPRSMKNRREVDERNHDPPEVLTLGLASSGIPA